MTTSSRNSSPELDPRNQVQRLQKYLARAGVASRRNSEELITQGRVSINGRVVTQLGVKVDPAHDVVCLDGVPLALQDSSSNVYLMLNKPAGYVTTMSDPQGRPTVASLVPAQEYPGLFPVGRLDRDTTGLLLFTNDGELGFALQHPSQHVDKVYEAHVQGVVTQEEADVLRNGIVLDDGPCAPAKIELLKVRRRKGDPTREGEQYPGASSTKLRITIHEGRNRQVKRMFKAIGHPVVNLHRASFGGITLGDLPQGGWRHLTKAELDSLRSSLSNKE
ncbi:MAG: rRNA pseudouridine synthase [Coriobacteriales bacterium]|nr:rRNA pseudouridine synthase [Coriobacteriales bacterium]